METASVVSSTSPAQFRLKSFLSLFVSAYTIHTTDGKIVSLTRFLILEGFYASTGLTERNIFQGPTGIPHSCKHSQFSKLERNPSMYLGDNIIRDIMTLSA